MVLANMRKKEHDLSKPERLASCGRPTPGYTWPCWTRQQPVARGEPGEICIRGPLVMKGYKDMPEQTAEAFAGGWLHTGDVGKLDEDGFLYIVDRTKDMIVTGGFNVFPVKWKTSWPPTKQWPGSRYRRSRRAVGRSRESRRRTQARLRGRRRAGALHAGPGERSQRVGAVTQVHRFRDAIPLTPVGKPDKKGGAGTVLGRLRRGVG